MNKKFADTPSKRFFKLSAMGAKAAGTYTRSKLKQAFINEQARQDEQSALYRELGEQVLNTLGELKGAAMKVGQVASQLQHLLPPEFAEQIAKLQKQSPPMPYPVIEQQIRAELGFLPEQLFAEFDQTPFAAASIGQVHKAVTLDGRQVVLKVQYPGVYQSCRSDLVHLKRLFRLSGLFKVEKAIMDELFDEIEDKLMAELDYQQEAQNLEEFRQFHQGQSFIIIPEVIKDFSTQRILCLSYEPGDSIATLRQENYSQHQINQLAVNLISAILHELLYHLKVHCDPHPGNFAFRKDGSVVIYDYGAVIDVKDVIIDQYIELVETANQQHFDKIDGLLLALGIRNPQQAPLPAELYQTWYDDFVAPLLNETRPAVMLDKVQAASKKHMADMLKLRGAFQPCVATVFLNRVLGGHFLNLAQMDTDIDFKPIILQHLFEEN